MPKYKTGTFWEASEDNSRKTCDAPGCTSKRHNISRYCNTHSKRFYAWGHPLGTALRKRDYAVEREEVKNIIELNMEGHEGIQYSLDFIQKTLELAQQGSPSVPCPDLLARLYQGEVSPVDVLAEVASLFLLLEQHGNHLIKDERHLVYTMGNKVIRLGGNYKARKGTEHRAVGQWFYDQIGVQCLNLAKAVVLHRSQENKNITAMCQPLNIQLNKTTKEN